MFKNSNQKTDLSFDVVSASSTFRTEVPLVVSGTIIGTVFGEEPSLGQRAVANFTFEALSVEVFVLNAKHFSRTFLLARLAVCLS